MEKRNAQGKISLKTRTVTPYWHYLKPLFRRYGFELKGPPYEVEIKNVLKKWLKEQDVELVERQGQSIDVVDYEFIWRSFHIGLEVKGHSKYPHNLTKIMNQLKRYLKYVELLIVIVHSSGLKSQLDRVLSVVPNKIRLRILLFKLAEINNVFFELENRIENLGLEI